MNQAITLTENCVDWLMKRGILHQQLFGDSGNFRGFH